MSKRWFGMASRFTLVVVVLVPSLAVVGWAGLRGLQAGRSADNSLYSDHLLTVRDTSALEIGLENAWRDGLRLLQPTGPADRQAVSYDLLSQVAPQVDSSVTIVQGESANDPREKGYIRLVSNNWDRFKQLIAAGTLIAGGPAFQRTTNEQLTSIFQPATNAAKSVIAIEVAQAAQAHRAALTTYAASLRWMLLAMILALLAAAGVVGWLIRSVLPRTLEYSAFAAEVSHGDYTKRLQPRGKDELAELGRTLAELAQRRQEEDLYDRQQLEFTDALQVTETEQEAHELVKRHLERSVKHASVTVLHRNNSADRLQAVTSVDPGSPLSTGLVSATPRSCLAIRQARPHQANNDDETLLSCPVCSGCPGRTTCTPLLVGGEVIGSVLTNHEVPLGEDQQRSVREAVTQAAPVLGNLRNLAIAEMRAATDSLTGLPNKRAIEDTLKRMVAQSSRSVTPLAALMCDLDQFKTINDRFGHNRGDEVLAAVGAVFTDTLRAGDFAGRYGGEEFLVLLPDTASKEAVSVAEKVRAAVAAVRLPTVENTFSMSIGVAVIPEHAVDAENLVRAADRALYTAKNQGRDQVELSVTKSSSLDDGQEGQDAGAGQPAARLVSRSSS